MYPGEHAAPRAHQAAVIMATSGEVITYAELERRSNRLAHWLRREGLQRLDHYSIFMENHARYVEAAPRASAPASTTPASTRTCSPEEVAYLLQNSRPRC